MPLLLFLMSISFFTFAVYQSWISNTLLEEKNVQNKEATEISQQPIFVSQKQLEQEIQDYIDIEAYDTGLQKILGLENHVKNSPNIQYYLAKIYIKKNNPDLAIKILTALSEKQPEEKKYFTEILDILLIQKNWDQIALYQKSQEIQSHKEAYQYILGALGKKDYLTARNIIKQWNTKDAEASQEKKYIAHFSDTLKSYDILRDVGVYFLYTLFADILREQEQYEISEIIAKQVINEEPSYRDIYLISAYNNLQLKKKDQVLALLKKAEHLDPTFGKTYFLFSLLYQEKNEREKAKQYAHKAIKRNFSNRIQAYKVLLEIAEKEKNKSDIKKYIHILLKEKEVTDNDLLYIFFIADRWFPETRTSIINTIYNISENKELKNILNTYHLIQEKSNIPTVKAYLAKEEENQGLFFGRALIAEQERNISKATWWYKKVLQHDTFPQLKEYAQKKIKSFL
jgi:hypothetical protein